MFKFKGEEVSVYFSATFSLASPLWDRKVPVYLYPFLFQEEVVVGRNLSLPLPADFY